VWSVHFETQIAAELKAAKISAVLDRAAAALAGGGGGLSANVWSTVQG